MSDIKKQGVLMSFSVGKPNNYPLINNKLLNNQKDRFDTENQDNKTINEDKSYTPDSDFDSPQIQNAIGATTTSVQRPKRNAKPINCKTSGL